MEIRHGDFEEIIDPNASFERVATGFLFTAGPVWHPVERSVVFSDIAGNRTYRWSAEKGLAVVRAKSNMANGNAFDRRGRLVPCEHATSRVSRVEWKTGTYEVLVSHYRSRELNSPNDMVVKGDGRIYFTDPDYGRMAGNGIPWERELPFCGVYCFDPEGGEYGTAAENFEAFPRSVKQAILECISNANGRKCRQSG